MRTAVLLFGIPAAAPHAVTGSVPGLQNSHLFQRRRRFPASPSCPAQPHLLPVRPPAAACIGPSMCPYSKSLRYTEAHIGLHAPACAAVLLKMHARPCSSRFLPTDQALRSTSHAGNTPFYCLLVAEQNLHLLRVHRNLPAEQIDFFLSFPSALYFTFFFFFFHVIIPFTIVFYFLLTFPFCI